MAAASFTGALGGALLVVQLPGRKTGSSRRTTVTAAPVVCCSAFAAERADACCQNTIT